MRLYFLHGLLVAAMDHGAEHEEGTGRVFGRAVGHAGLDAGGAGFALVEIVELPATRIKWSSAAAGRLHAPAHAGDPHVGARSRCPIAPLQMRGAGFALVEVAEVLAAQIIRAGSAAALRIIA